MHNADDNRHVRDFIDRCRASGIRVTPQRVAVFRELAATDQHPSAKTIYRRVREEMPAISLDTVYRTLSTLEAEGLVANVSTTDNAARYDARTEAHYHFVCRHCNRVIDVTAEDAAAFEPPDNAENYGRVESVNILLRGCCTPCLRKDGEQR